MLLASQTHVLRPRANLATVLVCLAPLIGGKRSAVMLEDTVGYVWLTRICSRHDRHIAT